jgi:hypothetical protein
MLYKLAAKYLPNPAPLRQAIERRQVAINFAQDGMIVYTISRNCLNVAEVRKAIEWRKRWELRVAATGGAAMAIFVVVAAALAARWTN